MTDVTKRYGLDFVHDSGARGEYLFPEITGAGAAMVDLNADGLLDLYLVQSGSLVPTVGGANAVYLNQGPGRQLKAVPDGSPAGYGMGLAVGDVNNDGRPDILLTNFGENRLLLGTADGSLEDVTAASGLSGEQWSTSATFFDFDRDGWLDLYVANYVEFAVSTNPKCYSPSSRRDYCGPDNFRPARDQLYRNLGQGRFEEQSAMLLEGYQPGPGLGVAAADFDLDGWLDLFVANDGGRNHLWVNRQGQGFSDAGLLSGTAVNGRGIPEASMGVAIADFDRDGDEDIFVTHLMTETNTFYRNLGGLEFRDDTRSTGLAAASRPYTGWATWPVDLDHDGWLDIVALNGAVRTLEDRLLAGDAYPFGQANQVFLNREGRSFDPLGENLPESFFERRSSRGGAFGDLDNNGAVDVLVSNGNGPAQLFLASDPAGPWLGVALKSRQQRHALGAWIELQTTGASQFWRIRTDGSYASANDPRALFHLGETTARLLRVTWPDGTLSVHPVASVNRYITLVQPR